MTTEEKREKIKTYCWSHKCEDCPLHPRAKNDFCYGDNADIELYYSLMFDENDYLKQNGKPTNLTVDIKCDVVNRPSHYADGKIEPIDYIEDKKLGFCLGNAVKYISRAGKKPGNDEITDLKKAIWYIERRIKEVENGD